MTMDNGTAPIGFHEGELSVQRRAGVELEAARLEGMLAPARLAGGAAKFLGQREFAVLTARDGRGKHSGSRHWSDQPAFSTRLTPHSTSTASHWKPTRSVRCLRGSRSAS